MFSLIDNPLSLPSDCFQVSCLFERDACNEADFKQLGLTLPQRLASAMPKRKAEFLAGRYCAQVALKNIGADWRHVIAIGENRAPCWPEGFVGSITHSKGFASATVASTNSIKAVGIDSELLISEKTARNVSSRILTDTECYEANTHLVQSPRQYLTLIFSAKESIFKCLYPLVQQYFDFHHAIVELDAAQPGQFRFQLRKNLGGEFACGYSAKGYYALADDFAHTAILLPQQ